MNQVTYTDMQPKEKLTLEAHRRSLPLTPLLTNHTLPSHANTCPMQHMPWLCTRRHHLPRCYSSLLHTLFVICNVPALLWVVRSTNIVSFPLSFRLTHDTAWLRLFPFIYGRFVMGNVLRAGQDAMWYVVVCSGIAVYEKVCNADLTVISSEILKIIRHGRINGQKRLHIHGAKVKVPAEIGSREIGRRSVGA